MSDQDSQAPVAEPTDTPDTNAGTTDIVLAEAERDETGLVVAADWGNTEGADGFEDQTVDDISIPFVLVLQSNSPQLAEGDDKYIEGAKAGWFVNSVTNEVIATGQEGFTFIPCNVDHNFKSWAPDRGGFRGRHNADSPMVLEAKRSGAAINDLKDPDNNDLQESYDIWGLLVPDGTAIEDLNESHLVILPCVSTKIGPYKKWNTRVSTMTVQNPRTGRKARPPRHAHRLRMKTFLDENPKGKFYNLVFEPAGASIAASLMTPGDDLFQVATSLREMIVGGQVEANYESAQGGSTGQDDIPF